ncbi:hypothetical protein FXO38_12020 [Capsicum annuum]|uniref:Ubiquitin-like protease family profile domain-containing protein n=1 Tax=Capsicum annuum TaxID=4072 RepID=A0A2G2YTE6_CAPAN|nr:hypothetical protein FXO37_25128 [Capsicum annuum]KAF3660842.1 hypothetical protein FXO38_12020 [Capsicum annuum]PHT72964.1 hypothetical protein T459_23749 [Capsicum annuum]
MFITRRLGDFGGTKVDEDNIDDTNNCGDVDSIINNVISSMFAASSSLPTSPDVKNTQAKRLKLGSINNDTTDVISDVDATTKFVNVDSTTCVVEIFYDEQESTHVSPMKNKVSPLKSKGSPMKKRTVLFILSQHLDTIFYYMRKKAKYEPNIVVKFTTTDFVFRNKIDALYHNFVKNGKDFSTIPEKHEVEEYIRGFYCDANVPWNKVNFYLKKGIAKSENDTLPIRMVDELPQKTQCDCGVFVCAFAEYVIHGRDIPKEIDIGHVTMRSFMLSGTSHDVVLQTGRISSWSTIYSTSPLLTTNLAASMGDCGLYMMTYAQCLTFGECVSNIDFNLDLLRTRYASMLWHYGSRKEEEKAQSDDEAPMRPPMKIEITKDIEVHDI